MTQLDPYAMTVIVRAVDFLFDQAAEIVRELRQGGGKASKASTTNTSGDNSGTDKTDILNRLKSVSDEINAEEIEHCMSQIHIYAKNVRFFETQIAHKGGRALARPELVNNLDLSQEELQKWIQKLKSLLEDSAKKEITIRGL